MNLEVSVRFETSRPIGGGSDLHRPWFFDSMTVYGWRQSRNECPHPVNEVSEVTYARELLSRTRGGRGAKYTLGT